jgi:hypothetical protein
MIDKPCSSIRQGQTSHQQLQRRTHAHCAAFATPDDARAAWHVLITCLLWLGCWASTRIVFAPYLLDTWWAGVLVPAWLFLRVGSYHRAFTVMHDATHNALFSHPWANKLSSIVCGSLMLIDGPDWGKSHRQHHTVEGMEVSGGLALSAASCEVSHSSICVLINTLLISPGCGVLVVVDLDPSQTPCILLHASHCGLAIPCPSPPC